VGVEDGVGAAVYVATAVPDCPTAGQMVEPNVVEHAACVHVVESAALNDPRAMGEPHALPIQQEQAQLPLPVGSANASVWFGTPAFHYTTTTACLRSHVLRCHFLIACVRRPHPCALLATTSTQTLY